jgi:hypothetical protein
VNRSRGASRRSRALQGGFLLLALAGRAASGEPCDRPGPAVAHLVDGINLDRVDAGLRPLAWHPALCRVAERRATELAGSARPTPRP